MERRSDFPVFDSSGAFADSQKEANTRILEFNQNKDWITKICLKQERGNKQAKFTEARKMRKL